MANIVMYETVCTLVPGALLPVVLEHDSSSKLLNLDVT